MEGNGDGERLACGCDSEKHPPRMSANPVLFQAIGVQAGIAILQCSNPDCKNGQNFIVGIVLAQPERKERSPIIYTPE